ncbi:RNA-binding RNA annealing protein [Exophiala dermatitidis]|uniref:RNA-binding RNA annealing protein n=1 Tax=Exophiala dermatitidis TaxID=5970 RepID=A0AAN6ES07_EXODE|nr:RNA-binding RNA annealing protein [Exophiala dermatitidis]KAJ4548524.1 RNA-binding RNA annealing protein [Exophiala dermatitidis]KAJ4621727.1 RNA-binding RNA annealing protein [Exophiala dermatitidis]KAJ4637832.1 RNA-binding RNA annealing protein [Exophiala dermatitidis]KAJ4639720.1 RNA-binding RNA annealing protein [Exophiala dermatitidis]
MSGRLDQSLDSIIDSQKKAKREVRRRKVGKPTGATAPVGGVKKSHKPAKSAIKPAAGTLIQAKTSKIVVSGLPHDVNEAQIKEYFTKSVGKVKKVSLQYNQNGQSRGIADIIFVKPDSAAKAAKDLNGMLIEVVVDASHVPEPTPAKSLADRVAYANPKRAGKSEPLTKTSANPKAQPKSATADKKVTGKDGAKGRPAGRAGKPKRGRNPRPKPKTAEELDAEMTDYWAGSNPSAAPAASTEAPAANGSAPAANAGDDMGMDEEISVSDVEIIC